MLLARGRSKIQSFVRLYLAAGLTMANSVTTSSPATLDDFGYRFNKDGQLRKFDQKSGEITDEAYEFNLTNDPKLNQERYEELGLVIDNYVYDLLEKEGLKKFPVPADPDEGEHQTFIFASPDFMETKDKPLLILIHGSGVVRAGQWARRLIINDCLQTGTQIPYIQRAIQLGYNVLVTNTNDNKRDRTFIRDSENPQMHVINVWDNYVKEANPTKIAIVAHSFGGICTSILAAQRFEEFEKKVFAVAFTDSAHYGLQGNKLRHLRKVGVNWAASDESLGAELQDGDSDDMAYVSAGHTQHEMTSASAIDDIFQYIEKKRYASEDLQNNEVPKRRKVSTEEDDTEDQALEDKAAEGKKSLEANDEMNMETEMDENELKEIEAKKDAQEKEDHKLEEIAIKEKSTADGEVLPTEDAKEKFEGGEEAKVLENEEKFKESKPLEEETSKVTSDEETSPDLKDSKEENSKKIKSLSDNKLDL